VLGNITFVAWNDVLNQLRDRSTLLWVFVMPTIFFYFIGTMIAGFSSNITGEGATPLLVVSERPGFLRDQIDLRLRDNDFAPEWTEVAAPGPEAENPARTLTLSADLSDRLRADQVVTARFDTGADTLAREFEILRVRRSLYTALADIVTADASSLDGLSASALAELNAASRVWQLSVAPAGERRQIPSGFQQAVPGMLVMFTLLVLLTSAGPALVAERRQGLLRRLASAPISRAEVLTGKWAARMVLAAVQITIALVIGTFLFDMDWGPDLGAVALILAAWGGFCASAGLWLGTVARTEAQASGLGVLAANALAALGGCWWPIEITPAWMQAIQSLLPTGWTMNALHKLISFQSGALCALPQFVTLVAAALIVGWVGVRQFRYE
jgi:ABC-2 type transport system permease protein